MHPSLYQGFGLPVIESHRYGKPCIVGARGALPEVAMEGGCFMIGETEARELSTAIRERLEDQTLYRLLVQQCEDGELKNWSQ